MRHLTNFFAGTPLHQIRVLLGEIKNFWNFALQLLKKYYAHLCAKMPGKPKQTSFDLTRTSPVQVRLKKPKRLTSTQSSLKKVYIYCLFVLQFKKYINP